MKPWKGYALAVLVGLILGAGPFGALWISGKAKLAEAIKDRDACLETLSTAQAAVASSDKAAADLARKPVTAAVAKANSVPTAIALDIPGMPGVVELHEGQPAPFHGGLFQHSRLAEAAEALAKKSEWALAKTNAEAGEKKAKAALADARKSAWRWKKKTVALTIGTGVAAYGLAKEKPWLAAAGLGLGIGGAILF